MTAVATDLVNHPPHYKAANGIEAIDVIEAYGLGDSFHLGNAMKYLLRAGRKGDPKQDLEKARWYLKRWMEVYLDSSDIEPRVDVEGGMSIDSVCDGFDLIGAHRHAVEMVLSFCMYELDEDDDDHPIGEAISWIGVALEPEPGMETV